MKLYQISTFIALVTLLSCRTAKTVQDESKIIAQIHTVLDNQEKAWNSGDIEAFMEGYLNATSLSFVGKSGVTRGWTQTLSNYKKSYPDKATMGRLEFRIIETKILSYKSAYMIGQYTLHRVSDKPSGHFTLLWEKSNGKWLIVSDHTSG